jgi:hypothetical protein
VAATIGKVARPADDLDTPLEVTLHGACSVAAAVARKDPAEAVLAELPLGVRARLTSDGRPGPAFCKLYDALLAIES